MSDAGPIEHAFLDLEAGLTVLYGRNGAGKTQLLAGIASAFGSSRQVGPAAHGESTQPNGELFFEWLAPEWADSENSLAESLYELDVVQTWLELPGNPWHGYPRGLDMSSVDPDDREVRVLEDLLSRTLPVEPDTWAPARRTARQLAVDLFIHECVDEEHALVLAAACDELARRARFSFKRDQVRLTGWADDATPALSLLASHLANSSGHVDGSHAGQSAEQTLWDLGYAYAGHVLEEAELPLTPPIWFGVEAPSGLAGRGAPVTLLCEGDDQDLAELTLDTLEGTLAKLGASRQSRRAAQEHGLLVQQGGSLLINPMISPLLEDLQSAAVHWSSLLLEDSPPLRCELVSPQLWHRHAPVRWQAFDPSGLWVELEDLSRAQYRWSVLAIRLAVFNHSRSGRALLLIDEPEAGLHRRAERHLAAGLLALAREADATVVVATHSPAFLSAGAAELVHVHRDADGRTVLSAMPADLRARIDELGLEPSDVLQHCRTIVLVEGQHELVIFEELFGDEFRAAGAILLTMRGARKLSATADSELIFRYTDAQLVVVLDNDDPERVTGIWNAARAAFEQGADHLAALSELTRRKKDLEQAALQEFCAKALLAGNADRVSFRTLSLPDIPEYLNVHDVAAQAPSGVTWSDLRQEWQRTRKEGNRPRFKDWAAASYEADYSDEGLRAATRRLDHVHPDLTALLEHVAGAKSTKEE